MTGQIVSPAQANLKMALWQVDADSMSSSELYAWLVDSGLPHEVTIRLHELASYTKKSGNKVLAVGKIVLIKILEFVKAHPFLVLGAGISAVVGAAVAAFGGTSLLFGLITVAPPVGLVVGGAALGAAALVGAKRILFDGTFTQGKKAEMLRQLKDQLKEVEAKERVSKLGDSDKTKFIILLKEPVRLNLISPKDAQDLIMKVESGRMPLKEAYHLVEDVINSAKS